MHPGRCPHRAHPRAGLATLAVVALALGGCSSSTAGEPSVQSPASASRTSSAVTTTAPPTEVTAPPTDATSTDPAPTSSAPPSAPASTPAASSAPASTAPPARITVVVTYSGWDRASGTVSVSAFVPSVLVPAATCTLVLGRNGVTYRVAKQAAATANSMQCGTIQKAGLAAGSWSGTVEFSSATVRGTSAPFSVRVGP